METTGYLLLGYTFIFGVLLLHVTSVYVRDRNLHQDLEMFEQLEKPAARKKTARKSSRKRRR